MNTNTKSIILTAALFLVACAPENFQPTVEATPTMDFIPLPDVNSLFDVKFNGCTMSINITPESSDYSG